MGIYQQYPPGTDPATFEELGAFLDVPFEEYMQWPGMSKSRLYRLAQVTPEQFKWEIDHPEAIDTKALRDGHRMHTALLEPEKYKKLFTSCPPPPEGHEKWDMRFKVCKEAWADVEAKANGRIITTREDRAQLDGMGQALLRSGEPLRILQLTKHEVSVHWIDGTTGLLMKARFDMVEPPLLADYKSAECAAHNPFSRSGAKYGYPIQMAIYYDAAKAVFQSTFAMPKLIVQEKTPTYGVMLYDMEPEQLAAARDLYKLLLMDYKACLDTDTWPGYSKRCQTITWPEWAFSDPRCYDPITPAPIVGTPEAEYHPDEEYIHND